MECKCLFYKPLSQLDTGKAPSREMYLKMGEQNIFRALLGPGPHLHGREIFGVKGSNVYGYIQREKMSNVYIYSSSGEGGK
tara:strand:+ start:335 stop:577 length:243 start_codon:yes stop_codon:yes gene_type:complete